jgi:hypothetical protein
MMLEAKTHISFSRVVAAQVDEFESKGLKPGNNHLIGSMGGD